MCIFNLNFIAMSFMKDVYNSDVESKFFQLAVLDTINRQVTDYCIPTYPGIYFGSYAPPPLWSPDSKKLIIENITTDQTTNRVILVDIVHGLAAQIAENVTPVGWMKAPQNYSGIKSRLYKINSKKQAEMKRHTSSCRLYRGLS